MPSKKIDKVCKYCNKAYLGIPKSRFCSNSCSGKNKKKRIYTLCANCNSPVERKLSVSLKHSLSYCSDKCRSKYQKTLIENKNPNYKKINFKCKGCNKTSKVTPSEARYKKYCNQK